MTTEPMTVLRALLPAGLEDAWRARTVELPDGHLGWTGRFSHPTTRPTPVLRLCHRDYSPARIAFIIRHGVEPEGPVRAECGMRHCVAPGHVDDTAHRLRDRAVLRLILGTARRPSLCHGGHDQSVHGRLHGNGSAYCQQCKNERKHAA